MKTLIVVWCCLAGGWSSVLAQKEGDVPGASLEVKAFEMVKAAERFSIGGIGVAGTIAPAETALRLIVKAQDGLQQCQTLLKEGTPEGKLYGLLGVKLLDKKAFEAAVTPFLADKTKVKSASGCELSESTVGAIAKEIVEGKLK